jgi:polysaccharide deacetylase family protein (PEP-CTERM system associated)
VAVVNALTFDIEDYYHVQAFADVIRPADWHSYPRRVEKNTYRLLEMLAARNIRATFFILGWVAERCSGLVTAIFKAGHEIGSHGYHHQMIGRGDEKAFRDDIVRAKGILEDGLGKSIKSYRAPSYSITVKTLWALDILAAAGFECDSSIFPIVHDNYGIADAPRFPHYKMLAAGARIAEFPPSTLRLCGVNFPVAGGGYFLLFPYAATAWSIRRINDNENQPAMVYLHPWEIDPEQPRIAASWRSRFRHYQNLGSTEEKLIRLLDEFSWAPMTEVLTMSLKNVSSTEEMGDGV